LIENNLATIPIFKSSLPRPEKWLDYLEIAYNNSKFSNFGEVSHMLEKRVAEFFGISEHNVVTCVNATQALTGAVSTAKENALAWTIPSWTFTATPASMISANKDFYFSDIDLDWRVSPVTRDVNVVDVLPFGEGIDLSRLENLCSGEVVIDAAASFDSLRFSNLSSIKRRFGLVVSFHPTKFPAGPEGAVFISNDSSWCRKFRYWTIFGMDERRESYFPGTNAKMNEMSASVILSSLDSYYDVRLNLVESSNLALQLSNSLDFEVNGALQKGFVSPYWIIRSAENRIKLVEEVFKKNLISTRRWWMFGCHKMDAYSKYSVGNLEVTENSSQTSIGLPFYPDMSLEDWERISSALKQCVVNA
jgi:dTDP-4-amino-4,6-dideoxygalactose transaminase